MVMRDASRTNAQLAPLKDKPIHLVVGKSGYTLGPYTLGPTADAIILHA